MPTVHQKHAPSARWVALTDTVDLSCFGRATVYVDKLLTELPTKIQTTAERGYLEEALICFRNKAFRAAVVMCWNLAFDHLCEFVLKEPARLADFNTQLPKSFPKADLKAVRTRDHFTELKEFQVLQVAIRKTSFRKVLRPTHRGRSLLNRPQKSLLGTWSTTWCFN